MATGGGVTMATGDAAAAGGAGTGASQTNGSLGKAGKSWSAEATPPAAAAAAPPFPRDVCVSLKAEEKR